MRRSRWLPVLPVLFCLGLVAVLFGAMFSVAAQKDFVARIAAGDRPRAPAFHLPVIWPVQPPWPAGLATTVDGKVSPNDLRGRPAVLNLWASWCVPCRTEAPLLNLFSGANPDVRFVGVDVQDVTPDAVEFLRQYHVPYLSVHDPGTGVYQRYGMTGVPETYYLDAQGRIVAHDIGQVTPESLSAGIAKARPYRR